MERSQARRHGSQSPPLLSREATHGRRHSGGKTPGYPGHRAPQFYFDPASRTSFGSAILIHHWRLKKLPSRSRTTYSSSAR